MGKLAEMQRKLLEVSPLPLILHESSSLGIPVPVSA